METDPDFGNIEFVRNLRSRSIRVRILVDGLKVSLPIGVTEKDAMTFINSKRKSILAKQNKLKHKKENHDLELSFDKKIITLTFVVEVKPVERENIFIALKDGVLTIEFPIRGDLQSPTAQEHCWNGINYFLRKEAKRLLPDRTKQLAGKFGFYVGDIKIQSSKSRWGSCSRARSINLSMFLMLLPAHLIDYVILHELCHTKEMNHSPKFWAWMNRVTDNNSTNLRTELKKYNMP
ncbi:MAG: M48 family metallopeptidase [Paludibacter sp.]